VAERTGGRLIEVELGELPERAAHVAQSLIRDRYVLTYVPIHRGSGWHAVEVATVRRNLEVHHRAGYWR
jgi:hypothetical protein